MLNIVDIFLAILKYESRNFEKSFFYIFYLNNLQRLIESKHSEFDFIVIKPDQTKISLTIYWFKFRHYPCSFFPSPCKLKLQSFSLIDPEKETVIIAGLFFISILIVQKAEKLALIKIVHIFIFFIVYRKIYVL